MKPHVQNPSFSTSFRAFALTAPARAALVLIACSGSGTAAWAQSAPEPTLAPVVVNAPTARQQLTVGGFADIPLRETPISATVVTAQEMREIGAQRLPDLYKLDASVSDAYNAVGYIPYATVRGYVLDNKFNARRDGLPISGDTAIGLANKERVEILKGTSGIQAGTSAPGGLINYVVKRPSAKPVRNVDLWVDSNAQIGASLDLSNRFGERGAQGYRLNVYTQRLSSAAPATRGSSQLLALALDSVVARDGLLEAELEWSRQSQPNVPGLSLLGNTGIFPAADAKLNLNRQAWSQPSHFEGLTGSLRYTHTLSDQWQWSAHAARQRLKTDDRIAFPYGCTDSNGVDYYADRFCPNGDVDLYDFRSDGERRVKTALQWKLDGKLQTGALTHSVSMGLLSSSSRIDTPDQVFNYAGSVNLSNPPQGVPPSAIPAAGSANSQREKTNEFFVTDVIDWSPALRTWLGLRHTELRRAGVLGYPQSFTTPWLALSYKLANHSLYASHGQGIESRVVPNLPAYGAQANQALPAQRSRQVELGLKSSWPQFGRETQSTLSVFDIRRPLLVDDGSSVVLDGMQRHQGLELGASHSAGAWRVSGSATWLRARQEAASLNPALNGLKPTNVPSHILRLHAAYRLQPAWLLGAHLSREGQRAVLPDNSLMLGAWTRLDASLQWDTSIAGRPSQVQWRIDNLLDKRFFQESPHQFGHAYLFPAQPRTLRMSLNISL